MPARAVGRLSERSGVAPGGDRWGRSSPRWPVLVLRAPDVSGSRAGDYRQNRAQEGRENPREERREHQDEDQDAGRHPAAEREVDDKGGQDQEKEDLDWADNGHDLLRLPSNAPSYPPDPVEDAFWDRSPERIH